MTPRWLFYLPRRVIAARNQSEEWGKRSADILVGHITARYAARPVAFITALWALFVCVLVIPATLLAGIGWVMTGSARVALVVFTVVLLWTAYKAYLGLTRESRDDYRT
jgi:hypothetical protein